MGPRVQSAWNLDELMPYELDFFTTSGPFSVRPESHIRWHGGKLIKAVQPGQAQHG